MVGPTENFFHLINVKIIKLDFVKNNNDFALIFEETQEMFSEIPLTKVYDIILNRYPNLMFDFFLSQEYGSSHQNIKDHFSKLVFNQKKVFGMFRLNLSEVAISVSGYTFKPIDDRIIEKEGLRRLNVYFRKNLSLKDIKSNPLAVDKFPHIEKITKNILQEGYEPFIHFLAWKIQKPCEIIPNHWIIQDDGGTGKTELLANYILDNLFNISIIGEDDIQSTYTSYMENTELIIAEEIEGYDNEKKVKMLTGAKQILVNEKYKSKYKIKNYNNWILFSNDIRPLKLGHKDRRFNVVGGGKRLVPLAGQSWGETMFGSAEDNKRFFEGFHRDLKQEIRFFYSYLKSLPLDRNLLQQTLNTVKKSELIAMNYTSEHQFMIDIKELGLDSLVSTYYRESKTKFYEEGLFLNHSDKCYYISSIYFYKLYVSYCEFSNLKSISHNHFIRRLKETEFFDSLFEDVQVIWHLEKSVRVLKIKCYKDENQTMEIETTDLNQVKSID